MKRFRRYLNIFIILTVFISWGRLSFFGGKGFMSQENLRSLRYFTILSNILEAIASLVWLWKKDEKLKYVAAVSVGVTFIVVLSFLGPTMGYRVMFAGATFWLHGAVPVIAILEMIFLCEEEMGRKDNIIACLPVLIYGVAYLLNNLINGIGVWPYTNDWYGFLRWGYPVGVVMFTVLILVTYLIGLSLRKLMIRL